LSTARLPAPRIGGTGGDRGGRSRSRARKRPELRPDLARLPAAPRDSRQHRKARNLRPRFCSGRRLPPRPVPEPQCRGISPLRSSSRPGRSDRSGRLHQLRDAP
jgi:hypothetical protein